MASVATGSTAEISDPNAKLCTKSSGQTNLATPSRYIPPPTTRADIAVPTMANSRIVPMFAKKFPGKYVYLQSILGPENPLQL